MKALFIWNNASIGSIKKHIIIVKQFNVKKIGNENGESVFSMDVVTITDESSFRRLKENWKNDEFNNIYILAELDWNKSSKFEGYKKGFEIIEKWGSTNSPSIEFFSLVGRKIIYNEVADNLKFMVKAFPFTDLIEVNDQYKFNTNAINKNKWDSFLYMTLTSYGVLDTISHRLNSIISSNARIKIELDSIISELMSYTEFIGEEIKAFCKNIEYTSSYINDLSFLIDKRIIETKGEKAGRIDFPPSLNILIVDDNEDDLKLIKKSVERYNIKEEKIITTNSGEDAMRLIAEGEDLDFVITDLELLDKYGFYQKIQGVEIYNSALKLKAASVGIITGLGRKGISKLLQIDTKFILSKRQLHRFNFDEEIDILLKNMLDDYREKEKRIDIEYGPNKSYFSRAGFKTALSRAFENKAFKKETWDYALDILNKFIDKNLSSNDWDKRLPQTKAKIEYDSFITERLKSLFSQRLILIFLSLKNKGIIYANSLEEEYSVVLNANEININKGYVDKLAIHYKTDSLTEGILVDGKQKDIYIGFRIEYIRLFPEEIKYITSYYENLPEPDLNILIRDNSPISYEWIQKYFYFEDEWYKLFNVPNNITNWQYTDLEKTWEYMYKDFLDNVKTSQFKETLNSIIENLTISIEAELYTILDNMEDQVKEIADLIDLE